MSAPRHFLDLADFDKSTLRHILDQAKAMKLARTGQRKGAKDQDTPLAGTITALIFQQPSTRTRVSFEVGIRQLGGETLLISASDMQLGRGETVSDTAKVLSRYVDAIMLRAKRHEDLLELARVSTVPVINGLTNLTHPCQILADILTIEEHVGPIAEQSVAWVGDGNNVAVSMIEGIARLGGTLRLACPPQLLPRHEVMTWAEQQKAKVELVATVEEAVAGATAVVTDAWVSMHDVDAENRHNLLKPYQVNERLLKHAAANAIFLHCLPAHRGEEVTAAVMDGPQSVVFDEAENRLHVQKAIMRYCLG